MKIDRRKFIERAGGAGLLTTLGGLDSLLAWGPADAGASTVTPDLVRFTTEIEPLVRLIEETPREDCVDVLAARLRAGMSHRQFLAALFLAGIRNINPRPPGGKFHCVFAVHSADYLGRLGPAEERLLPVFWVLDYFKESQARDLDEGDFALRPIVGQLPAGENAWREFHSAMAEWDTPRAERAMTAIARSAGREEIFEVLWAYGARDVRALGHKAIFTAHTWRTLDTVGWQHAEPALRSLVRSLLYYGAETTHRGYAFRDQCYLPNVERMRTWSQKPDRDWRGDQSNDDATRELLEPLRKGNAETACDLTLRFLAEGKCQSQAVWNAAHLAAGELVMRQPNILGVHAGTSLNALHFAYRTTQSQQTRLLLLLQGVGWMAQFKNMAKSEADNPVRITAIGVEEIPAKQNDATEAIAAAIAADPDRAARMTYRYGQQFEQSGPLIDVARHLVFAKADNVHHLKWCAAVFEDLDLVSPQWQPHLLAASTYYLRGTGNDNSPVVERAVAALRRT
jgi:hypothetical protein